ncbi:FMN-dependent NADH-azoreductase [Achromobacter spanius]|uniref:FMN dependent NADH:quinone oxidoreductase n=2 Tax=Achromobacter spanius TaxID=217203 RepID=A0A2S0IB22_9BURK|nr:FMN-dependent NADH-azoreductase [Achromobacter spanius]
MKLLHIDCSPKAESNSRALSAGIVAHLLTTAPTVRVTRRDLGLQPIAHAAESYAHALSSPAALQAAERTDAVRESEALIQELELADVVVIGTPMNNFTVPSVLKAWIDQILRMGRSIGVSPTGHKVGLLQDKPVYIAIASGGFFTGPNAKQPDFLTPYLQAALGCVGLHSLQFLVLQGTAFIAQDQLDAARHALVAGFDADKLGITAVEMPRGPA